MIEGKSGNANAIWDDGAIRFGVADQVQAMALFGLGPVNARVRYIHANGDIGITIEGGDHDGKQTIIGVGQVVGSVAYRERMNG